MILGVVGNRVIVRLPHKDGVGLEGFEELSLADGKPGRKFRLGVDCARPKYRFHHIGSIRAGQSRLAFWSRTGEEKERCEAIVLDADAWSEVGRFDISGGVYDFQILGDQVFGVVAIDFRNSRAFTVDLKGAMYSLPLRDTRDRVRFRPDGTRELSEATINAKCGYLRPSEWAEVSLDRDLRKRDGRSPSVSSSAGGVEAVLDGGRILIRDADGGRLRAVVQALSDEYVSALGSFDDPHIACDGERVYFAWPTGLRAYSTRPVDPARPDPQDPGDPAWGLARCRAALVDDDFEAGLKALRGIAISIRLRPSQRKEAAELLSQLARSNEVSLYPVLWEEILYNEGPLAGELFMADYERRTEPHDFARPLIAVGTESALQAVARKLRLPASGTGGADAKVPLDRLQLLRANRYHSIANGVDLGRTMDDAEFQKALPRLRAARVEAEMLMNYMWPAQIKALLEGRKSPTAVRIAGIAEIQEASRQKGEGEKVPMEIRRPAKKTVVEEF